MAPPLLDQTLASFATREPVSCSPDTPIHAVLETMRREAIGAMVIVDPDSRPLGVFTLRDVLEKVALEHADPAQPVATVMARKSGRPSRWLRGRRAHGARGSAMCSSWRMGGWSAWCRSRGCSRRGRWHRRHQRGDRGACDVDAMVAATAGVRALVDRLLEEQMPAESVTRIITTLNDLVTQCLIEIVGCAPALERAGGCWIALGSQGRCEQTLATDQDNAIIFTDAADVEACRRALLPLARRVNDALDRCGFPLCRGDVMACNPKWCLSLAEWRQRFARWIDEPDPQALLHATIFFDFRPIDGNRAVAAALRAWLAQHAKDHGRFLLQMARNALENQPPLGLVRDFILAHGGEHPDTLDLKVNGVQLFVRPHASTAWRRV